MKSSFPGILLPLPPPPKYGLRMFLGGDTGDDTGVVDAIVPPTPVLNIGLEILAAAAAPMAGDMNAGLWGEPIPITKGVLVLEDVLGRRSEGCGCGELRGNDVVGSSRERDRR
jgi:hypothetical protein